MRQPSNKSCLHEGYDVLLLILVGRAVELDSLDHDIQSVSVVIINPITEEFFCVAHPVLSSVEKRHQMQSCFFPLISYKKAFLCCFGVSTVRVCGSTDKC